MVCSARSVVVSTKVRPPSARAQRAASSATEAAWSLPTGPVELGLGLRASGMASRATALTAAEGHDGAARADAPVVSATGVPGTMVEGHLLRFSEPAEGTLQFLPGRLEIASGIDTGREIRFVRVPGPNGLEVTFGRSEGELYKHIQLRDQTVSRSHARLRLEEGRWHLFNYSQTNPVVHNGQLLGNDAEQPLDDGDRIEMGEVLFTFRSR